MLHQRSHGALQRFGGDDVVVIQHKDQVPVGTLEELGGELGKDGLRWWRWRRRCGVQQGERAAAQVRVKGLQSSDHRGKEAHRLIIFRLQRQPGDIFSAPGEPLAE